MKKIITILLCTVFLHFLYGGSPITHTFNSTNLNVNVGEQVFFRSTITQDDCGGPTLVWDFGPNAIPSSFNMTFPANTLVTFNLPPVMFTSTGVQNVSQTLLTNCGPAMPGRSILLQVIVASPLNIPTLSQWGLFVLGILIMIFGAVTLKRTYKSKQKLSI